MVFEALFINRSANEVALDKAVFFGEGVHLDPTDPPRYPTSSLEAEGDLLESSDDISEDMLGLELVENDLSVLVLVLAKVLILLDSFRDLKLLAGADELNSSSPSSLTSLTVGTGYGPEYVDGVASVCSEDASSWTSSGTGGVVGFATGLERVNSGTE